MGMFLAPESSLHPTAFHSFCDMPPSSSSGPFTDSSSYTADHFSSVFSSLHDSMAAGPPSFEPSFRCNSGSGVPHLRTSPSSPAMLDSPLSTSPPLYAPNFPAHHMGPHPHPVHCDMMELPHKGPPPMRGHSFEGFPSHPIFTDMPPPPIHSHQHGPPPPPMPPMPPMPGQGDPACGPFPPAGLGANSLTVQDLPAGTFPDLPDLRDPSYYSTLSHCPERQAVLLTSRIKVSHGFPLSGHWTSHISPQRLASQCSTHDVAQINTEAAKEKRQLTGRRVS